LRDDEDAALESETVRGERDLIGCIDGSQASEGTGWWSVRGNGTRPGGTNLDGKPDGPGTCRSGLDGWVARAAGLWALVRTGSGGTVRNDDFVPTFIQKKMKKKNRGQHPVCAQSEEMCCSRPMSQRSSRTSDDIFLLKSTKMTSAVSALTRCKSDVRYAWHRVVLCSRPAYPCAFGFWGRWA
jgi:hypothetical protein